MPANEASLYLRVVRITDVYLGPAADRFIARQVQNHLHKEPTDLSEDDLLKLIDWVRVAMAVITEDGKVVDEYIHQLQALAQTDKPKPKHK